MSKVYTFLQIDIIYFNIIIINSTTNLLSMYIIGIINVSRSIAKTRCLLSNARELRKEVRRINCNDRGVKLVAHIYTHV